MGAECVPPPSALVAWWPGEGDASTLVGTNHGVLKNGATFAAGKVGQAFRFDGSNDYVAAPGLEPFHSLTSAMTIELWFKAEQFTKTWQALVTKGDSSWRLQRYTNTSMISFDTTGPSNLTLAGTRNVLDGNWHHAAAVFDGARKYLYLDGTLDVSVATTGSIATNNFEVRIGENAERTGRHFAGWMDEVTLYNRALTAHDIAAIYAAGSEGKCRDRLPPWITAQPLSLARDAGATATFSVTASGTEPLSYQWQKDNADLQESERQIGTQTRQLTLANLQITDSGYYRIVVTNAVGRTNSLAAALHVMACELAPSGLIAWWPGDGNARDQVGTNHGGLQRGATATATGMVGPAFHLDGTDDYVEVAHAKDLATEGSLTVMTWVKPTVSLSQQSSWARFVDKYDLGTGSLARRGWGLLTSGNYASQPGRLKFEVADGTGTSSAGWQELATAEGDLAPANAWTHLAGVYDFAAGTLSLYVNGVRKAHRSIAPYGAASASVPLRLGCDAHLTSRFKGDLDEVAVFRRALSAEEIAAVHVAAVAGMCKDRIPPLILAQPEDLTGGTGATATFSVRAGGTGPLAYRWTKGNVELNNGPRITGADTATLTVANLTAADAGLYRVTVTNPHGTALSAPAELALAGDCYPPPASLVGWWSGDGTAQDSAGSNHATNTSGVSYSAGRVDQSFAFDSNNDRVMIPHRSDYNPTATGFTVQLWVKGLKSQPQSPTALVEKSHGFADHTGWAVQANPSDGFVRFAIGTGSGFPELFSKVDALNGSFHHVAGTWDGSSMRLYVDGQFQAATPLTVVAGNSRALNVGFAWGGGSAQRFFRGQIDEVAIHHRALSAEEIALLFNLGTRGSGFCKSPSILQPPQDRFVAAGDAATFGVGAVGGQPLSYRWFKDDVLLTDSLHFLGTTTERLIVLNAQAADAGKYSVEVTNAGGKASAGPARLTVTPAGGVSEWLWGRQSTSLNDWTEAWAATADAAGNAYVSGTFKGVVDFGTNRLIALAPSDMFVAKYSPDGAVQWARQGSATDTYFTNLIATAGYGVVVDSHGYTYVAGSFAGTNFPHGVYAITSKGDADVFLAKYDPSGMLSHTWTERAGGTGWDAAQALAMDGDGNLYVTGQFGSPTADFGAHVIQRAGAADVFIAKYSSGGTNLWARAAGGTQNDMGYGIAVDGAGNVYVTGYFEGRAQFGGQTADAVGLSDVFLAKYNSVGTCEWVRSAGGAASESAFALTLIGPDRLGITGYFQGGATFGTTTLPSPGIGHTDLFVAEYDRSGSLRWARHGGGTNVYGRAVATDPAGRLLVAGILGSRAEFGGRPIAPAGALDQFLAAYDGTGDVVWNRAGGQDHAYANGLACDETGNLISAGAFAGQARFGPDMLGHRNGLAAFVAKAGAVSTGGCTPPPTGLLGWWPGDGNAFDLKGTHHGTLVNGATYADGSVGQAFRFDGVDDAVDLGTGLIPGPTFTEMAWIFSQVTDDTWHGFLGYEPPGGLKQRAPGLWVYQRTRLHAGFGDGANWNEITTDPVLRPNAWNHVAVTFDRTTYVAYVNGVAVLSTNAYQGRVPYATPVRYLGRANDFFAGLVDEVAIFNRALTASDIAAIHAAGHAGVCADLPPVILAQPADQTKDEGDTATFAVTARGGEPLAYQWFKEHLALANDVRISGAQAATLTLAGLQTAQSGGYSVIVTNAFGAVTSVVARLTVVPGVQPEPLRITRQPQNVTTNTGANVVLEVGVSGEQPYFYQWRRGVDAAPIQAATNASLVLSNVQLADAGVYSVMVSNRLESVLSTSATVTVLPPLPSLIPAWRWAQSAAGNRSEFSQSLGLDSGGHVYVSLSSSSAQVAIGRSNVSAAVGMFNRDLLAKYTPEGGLVWARPWADAGVGQIFAGTVDAAGNVYTVGRAVSSDLTFGPVRLPEPRMVLVSHGPNAAVRWARADDADPPTLLELDGMGHLLVAGTFGGKVQTVGGIALETGRSGFGLLVASFDAEGGFRWARSAVCDSPNTSLHRLLAGPSGEAVLAGSFESTNLAFGQTVLTNASRPGDRDAFVACYLAQGDLRWARAISGSDDEAVRGLAVDQAGRVAVVAESDSTAVRVGDGPSITVAGKEGTEALLLASLDAGGATRWTRVVSGPEGVYGGEVEVDAGGNLFVVGRTGNDRLTIGERVLAAPATPETEATTVLASWSVEGALRWARLEAAALGDLHLTLDIAGNVLLGAGFSTNLGIGPFVFTNAHPPSSDLLVASFANRDGEVRWAKTAGGPGSDYLEFGPVTDRAGNVSVAGFYTSPDVSFGTNKLVNLGEEDVFVAQLASTLPPVILAQPTDVTTNSGVTFPLTLLVGGAPPVVCHWWKGDQPLLLLTNVQQNAGLQFVDALPAHSGEYTAVLTNAFGAVTSRVAQVTVTPVVIPETLKITRQPQSVTTNSGATVVLSVEATGTGTLTYQWRKGSEPLLGQTGTTLTLERVQPRDEGSYNVVVTDANGTVFSAPAVVAITAASPEIPEWRWAFQLEPTKRGAGQALALDTAGRVYVGGRTDRDSQFGSQVLPWGAFLCALSTSGQVIWARGGFAADGVVQSLALGPGGNLHALGFFKGEVRFAGDPIRAAVSDHFLAQCDPAGQWLWGQRVGLDAASTGSGAVGVDAQGDLCVATTFHGGLLSIGAEAQAGLGGQDVLVAKYDREGRLRWPLLAGGVRNDAGCSVGVDGQGFLSVAGVFQTNAVFGTHSVTSRVGTPDLFLARYDASGQCLWVRSAGSSHNDWVQDLSVDTDGNSYLTGYSAYTTNYFGSLALTNAGHSDIFVAKYDPEGTLLWAKALGSEGADYGQTVAHDFRGGLYLAGEFAGETLHIGDHSLPNPAPVRPGHFVARFDRAGALSWIQAVPAAENLWFLDMVADAEENVYLTGNFSSNVVFGSTILSNAPTAYGGSLYVAKLGPAADAFSITAQPQPVTTNRGATVTLTVQASGPNPLTYQWYRGETRLADRTASNLVIQNAQPTDSGAYRVEVADAHRRVFSAEALVQILPNGLSNVRAVQRAGTGLVDVWYDFWHPQPLHIYFFLRQASCSSASSQGDVATKVQPGRDRHLVWDAGTDCPDHHVINEIAEIQAAVPNGPALVARSAPFEFNTERAPTWTLRAYADRDRNGRYDAGEALGGAEVYYAGRLPSHRAGQTDGNGLLTINRPLRKGAQLFVRQQVHLEPAGKAGHESVGSTMFTLWRDSDVLIEADTAGTGDWISRVATDDLVNTAAGGAEVQLALDHWVFEWNLLVACEVSSPEFTAKLKTGFEKASRLLYDATDGQMKFGQVAVLRGVAQAAPAWTQADMRVYTTGHARAQTDTSTGLTGTSMRYPGPRQMHFGARLYESGGNYRDPDTDYYAWAIVHEFGHYALGLFDEYENGNPESQLIWSAYRQAHPAETTWLYGLMDHLDSELSSYNDYLPSYAGPVDAIGKTTITGQLYYRILRSNAEWYPCWAWIKRLFEGWLSEHAVSLVPPPPGVFQGRDAQGREQRTSEDRSGPTIIPEPYGVCEVKVLEPFLMAAQPMGGAGGTANGVTRVLATRDGQPLGAVQVTEYVEGAEEVRVLGWTDAQGRLTAYDVAPGSVLRARHLGAEREWPVELVGPTALPIHFDLGRPDRPMSLHGAGSPSATLGWTVSATLPPGAGNPLALRVVTGAAPASAPAVMLHPNDGAGVSVALSALATNRFTGAANLGAALWGTVEITCQRDDGGSLSSADLFTVVPVSPTNAATLQSRDGLVNLHLPEGAVSAETAAVLYSGYGPSVVPTGWTKARVGPVLSLALGVGTGLNGTQATLNWLYPEADLAGVDESTLRLYRWNEPTLAWDLVSATLGMSENLVCAMLSELGAFALWADVSQDTTSPGPITDLSAATGDGGWAIRLRWTAPGDDGLAGTAAGYVLKRSTTEITAATWDELPAVPLSLVPEPAGTVQSRVVTMPDPGVLYFFALRAQDEAGNLGPLSNLAAARSHQTDTDGDGLSDAWEATHGLNPADPADAVADQDADGLNNLQEAGAGTDPGCWDTDGDGMSDAWEVGASLDPTAARDHTGDPDGDGLSNADEFLSTTDPNHPDTDQDGLPDGWEVQYGLCPFSASGDQGADGDPDQDGQSNLDEYRLGTDPVETAMIEFGPCELLPDGRLELSARVQVGRRYEVQVSTDLVTWSPRMDFVSTNNLTVLYDTPLPAPSVRFYRLVKP